MSFPPHGIFARPYRRQFGRRYRAAFFHCCRHSADSAGTNHCGSAPATKNCCRSQPDCDDHSQRMACGSMRFVRGNSGRRPETSRFSIIEKPPAQGRSAAWRLEVTNLLDSLPDSLAELWVSVRTVPDLLCGAWSSLAVRASALRFPI